LRDAPGIGSFTYYMHHVRNRTIAPSRAQAPTLSGWANRRGDAGLRAFTGLDRRTWRVANVAPTGSMALFSRHLFEEL
jgi:hypothetical protein